MKWLHKSVPIVAIALTSPALGQQADPGIRQAVERIAAMYSEHFNKQDATGIAELYTKDGVLVSQSPAGAVKSGTQAIAQNYENLFKLGANRLDLTVGQAAQLGGDVIVSWGNEYHITGQGQNGPLKIDGDWTGAYVRDAGTWKLRLVTAVPKPPPPAPK
jgi:uncharacterized protein (TIGR02246 family)